MENSNAIIEEISNSIINKLETVNIFTEREKAYIEKALMTANFYEDLLDMSLGLKKNTAGLKFNVHPYVEE